MILEPSNSTAAPGCRTREAIVRRGAFAYRPWAAMAAQGGRTFFAGAADRHAAAAGVKRIEQLEKLRRIVFVERADCLSI